MATHPGVYCLRTNIKSWDSERMWRTNMLLTDVGAVFRPLKSELGLRPIYHQKPQRTEGAFIYFCVGLSTDPDHPAQISCQWEPTPVLEDHALAPDKPYTHHHHISLQGWSCFACPQGHCSRTSSTHHLRSTGHQSRSRMCVQNDCLAARYLATIILAAIFTWNIMPIFPHWKGKISAVLSEEITHQSPSGLNPAAMCVTKKIVRN